MSTRFLQRLLVLSVTSTAVAVAGAGAASAGEITGNGTPKLVNGSSICAYSGQNDAFHDPSKADFPGDELARVQSYGQLVKAGLKGVLPSPGAACNGHTGEPARQ